jgi:peptide/nickel transport system permease protein
MLFVLARKAAIYSLTLLALASLDFALVHTMPGDALIHLLGEEGYAALAARGPEAVTSMRRKLGLDKPMGEQLRLHLSRIATGDWGWSHHYGQPAARVIARRLRWSLLLLAPALLVSTALGGWLGALSGWRGRTKPDRLPSAAVLCIYSTPAYCLGLLALVCAARTRLVPLGGVTGAQGGPWDVALHMALPMAVLTLHGAAYKFMIMRNAVRQELEAPYVLTALSKGLTDRRVLFGHVLRNALPPYIAVVGMNVGFLAGGALLVEAAFSWPGMGTLIYGAVLGRDHPMLFAALLALGMCVLAANLLADFCCALVDPRVREGGPSGV